MSSHKIDKLHLPRVMYNVPIDNGLQAWPVFLHWYISPEDSHQKSRAQKIVMRTACENAELTWWLQEGVPAKHIYALLSVMKTLCARVFRSHCKTTYFPGFCSINRP